MSQANTRDWEADLHRLVECYPTHKALADEMGVGVGAIRHMLKQPESVGEDLRQKVREHREAVRLERVRSAERALLVRQVLVQLENAETMCDVRETIRRTREYLDSRSNPLCDL